MNSKQKKKPTNPGKPPKDDPPTEDPPADPTQTIPWGIDRIDADLVSLTGEGVKVAVLDTGIDKDHPDLSVAGGINFIPKGSKVDATRVQPRFFNTSKSSLQIKH